MVMPATPGATATGDIGNHAGAAVWRPADRDAAPAAATPASLSLVVPLYNEQDNVEELATRIHEAMVLAPWPWELVLVDDGSADATLERLMRERRRFGDHVRVIALRRNYGQTAAMRAGIDAARGDLIATLDGDLQNDPRDVLRLARELCTRDLDLVAGWRQQRQDKWLTRKLPSRIANSLIGRLTGIRLHDYGCTLKVFRAEVLRNVRLFGEMHRFIPAWLVMVTSPRRIAELPVNHLPRMHGESKYGLWRTIHVLLDLLVVVFFLRFEARPAHFFGLVGLALGTLGGAALAWLAYVKFVLGEAIGGRPLLLIGSMCVLAAIQLITTGVLAEVLLRNGRGDSDPGYLIDPRCPGEPAGWKR